MKKETYTWSENPDDEIWYNSLFGTIHDCLLDAKMQGKTKGDKIAIGICKPYEPHVDCDSLLDKLCEDACEQCGEVAEDFLAFDSHNGYEKLELLQEKMDKALLEWLSETEQMPRFYRVTPLPDMYEIK